MKVVVIGGTGLIGSKVVKLLSGKGHEVVAASPSTGVNAVTGEGLAKALAGAAVVVDVSNAPSFEAGAVMEFFGASARNLAEAEVAAKVQHHVALSVVGTDRLQESGYFRAKLAQEEIIRASGVPYTIVRATQFFEFVGAIAQSGMEGEVVRLPVAKVQPIAAAEVGEVVAEMALGSPVNGVVELAGPERMGIEDWVRQHLAARGERKQVVADVKGSYFGTPLEERSLVPLGEARLGRVKFEEWVKGSGGR